MTVEVEVQKEMYIARMVKYLPTLRVTSGLTQQQLAEKIGMSRQSITAIEKGKRPMTWSVYLALMFVFSQYENAAALMKTFQLVDEMFVKVKL